MKFLIIPMFIMLILTSCVSHNDNERQESNNNSDYHEQHRPKFHFSPKNQWMNDPNGMVYLDGTYHLFYQHYPEDNVWGPMHWGHAISPDLMNWEHKPIALYPDDLGYIFSGSAVFDKNNTSGLGTSENPPLIAIFTYHDPKSEKAGKNDFQTQGIAYSLDKGETWTKYEGNPVLGNPGIRDFRDPKVIWYKPENKWIMVLAVADHVSFYSSLNLLEWKLESNFGKDIGAHGGVWECPDLFQLDHQSGIRKWVLLVSINSGGPNGGSATQYFIGEFDGKVFIPINENIKWIDYGMDNYAGVTWSNVTDRRIFIGWMSNWLYATRVPTTAWRNAMTLPRVLKLEKVSEDYFVSSMPVNEFDNSRLILFESYNQSLQSRVKIDTISELKEGLFEAALNIEKPSDFKIEVGNGHGEKVIIGFDNDNQQFYIDRISSGETDFHDQFGSVHYAPRISNADHLPLRLIFDVASVELFADNGLTVMTDIFFPAEEYSAIQIIPENETIIKDMRIFKIK